MASPLDKLVTLLKHAKRGAIAIAMFDNADVRRQCIDVLRKQLPERVYEVYVSQRGHNPIDLVRNLKPERGDVICLLDLARGLPEALGYLDLQREVLVKMELSIVCWVTPYEQRELANKAPNFYAFRSALFDFTTTDTMPTVERLFIGREKERAALADWLLKGGPVVITGLGGVGKTTLARQVAEELRDHFTGGEVWVNCETKPPAGAVILTAGVALVGDYIRNLPPDEQRQRVTDAMRAGPCLLVLDNFETIVEDSELLNWLKTIATPSAALLTSRQSVTSLGALALRLTGLTEDEAVQLFTERARLAGWEGEDERRIADLCLIVGGVPAAIELLAARAGELPLKELTELVKKNLDAISDRDDPLRAERHRSVAACIRMSFDRLSQDAKSLLLRLSLLPDGAGADHIGPYTGIEQWHQPIDECVRHSLLNLDRQRYRYHPLVRAFALQELGDAREEWQRRFVNYFAELLKKHGGAGGLSDIGNLAILDDEWRNAEVAAEVGNTLNEWEKVVDIATSLTDFLQIRGLWAAGVRLNECALSASLSSKMSVLEGIARNNLGIFYGRQRRYHEALGHYARSREIKHELSDDAGEAQTLNNMGLVYHNLGMLPNAVTCFQDSLTIKRSLGDMRGVAATLTNLSDVLVDTGLTEEAEAALRTSVEIFHNLDDDYREGTARYNLGKCLAVREKWPEAEAEFNLALRVYRKYGNPTAEGAALESLAIFHFNQGKYEQALDFARQALDVLERTEDKSATGEVRALMADVDKQLAQRPKNNSKLKGK